MRARSLWLVVFVLLVAGRAASGADAQFAGTWKTTFGTMRLTQAQNRVEGTYVMGDQLSMIQGQVKDRKLEFTYRELDAGGEGWFELAADGKSFSGKWREKGEQDWGTWEGQRVGIKPQAAPRFDGVWTSTFGRMRLVQNGKKVHGYYAFAEGSSIDGTVENRRMTFNYQEPAAKGSGRFDLSADGEALHGKWKATGSGLWQDWHAVRVHPAPGIAWLVVIEAPWEQNLQQQEYSFGRMLKSFFARSPHVQVRQRFFNNKAAFRKWCREVSYLAEPVVLSIATHGSAEGITVGGRTIGPNEIADNLRYAANLKLVHFSSCLVMQGDLAERMMRHLRGYARFPISGYSTSVDWAASAVLEFMYYDLILSRHMKPQEAAKQIGLLLPFSGPKDLPGAAIKSAGFKILAPR